MKKEDKMGQTFLPSFALAATSRYMKKESYELPPILNDLAVPRDQIYLHPYIMEDPMQWPGGQCLMDFSVPETGLSLMLGPTSWNLETYEETGGGSLPYKIMGIAKDAGGLPKAGCTAVLRCSYNDVEIARTITDTNGIYGFEVKDTTTQYYVEVFQIAPSLGGVSVRTLTGA